MTSSRTLRCRARSVLYLQRLAAALEQRARSCPVLSPFFGAMDPDARALPLWAPLSVEGDGRIGFKQAGATADTLTPNIAAGWLEAARASGTSGTDARDCRNRVLRDLWSSRVASLAGDPAGRARRLPDRSNPLYAR